MMTKLLILLMTLCIALATFVVVISDYIYAKLFAIIVIVAVSFLLGAEFDEDYFYYDELEEDIDKK